MTGVIGSASSAKDVAEMIGNFALLLKIRNRLPSTCAEMRTFFFFFFNIDACLCLVCSGTRQEKSTQSK